MFLIHVFLYAGVYCIDGERWEKWKSQLANLSQITVDRCVKPACLGNLKIAEIHNFADASQIAYGAVSYLRLVDVEERIHCAFLIGDCAKIGIVSCSVSRSVGPDCKRRVGHSSESIEILDGLHLCVTVHQKSVKAFPYLCYQQTVSHS